MCSTSSMGGLCGACSRLVCKDRQHSGREGKEQKAEHLVRLGVQGKEQKAELHIGLRVDFTKGTEIICGALAKKLAPTVVDNG